MALGRPDRGSELIIRAMITTGPGGGACQVCALSPFACVARDSRAAAGGQIHGPLAARDVVMMETLAQARGKCSICMASYEILSMRNKGKNKQANKSKQKQSGKFIFVRYYFAPS